MSALVPDDSTRSRIIVAALRVFATRGFEAASLKEITTASGANVAAVHYHFGSKDVLIREVLHSVSAPINRLRLQQLDALPAGRRRTLRHVVTALLAPPIRLSFDTTGDGRLLMRLLMQARALPREVTNTPIFQQYDALALRFVDALVEVVPGLPREEAFWRYAFAIGALLYIVTDADESYHRLHRLSGGLCNTDDPDTIIRQLVDFVMAGMRARGSAPRAANRAANRPANRPARRPTSPGDNA